MLKQNKPQSVTLRVTRSGTKTNTLMEYVPGESMPRELGGALFLNPDKAEFYRQLQRKSQCARDGAKKSYITIGQIRDWPQSKLVH
jgi:hypothetical protein